MPQFHVDYVAVDEAFVVQPSIYSGKERFEQQQQQREYYDRRFLTQFLELDGRFGARHAACQILKLDLGPNGRNNFADSE
jgi:hypothetical protein